MPIKLYKNDASPAVRSVMMTCDILKLPFEPIEINLQEKQHLTPEFLKKNPLHTVPVLEDGELILQDSHAIMMYLVDKYGKDDSLYPKDVDKRALVSQKLFFEASKLSPSLRAIAKAAFYEGANEITEKQRNDMYEAYGFLEEFLCKSKYIAGDQLTIADLSIIALVTSAIYVLPLDEKKYPKTAAWVKGLEHESFCEKYNVVGTVLLGERIKKCLEQNKAL